MSEVLTKVRGKVANLGMKTTAGLRAVAMSTACAVPAFAAESGTPGSGSGISINFDINQMFTFANIIIEALMPVVYITAGLGIGFLIINSLKAAFR